MLFTADGIVLVIWKGRYIAGLKWGFSSCFRNMGWDGMGYMGVGMLRW